MNVDPGKLDRRVLLQRPTVAQDPIANELESWETVATLWCGVNSLYGEEYWAAAARGQQNTKIFTTRWTPRLAELDREQQLTKHRLLFEGKPYDIKHYDDVSGEHRLVKLKGLQR